MVSREAFEKIGYYDSTLPRYTDWDWLLRLTLLYPLSVLTEPLAIIYRGSQPQAKVADAATRRFLDKHFQEFRQFGYYGKRALGKRYLEVAVYYYLEGNRAAGWAWFRKALSRRQHFVGAPDRNRDDRDAQFPGPVLQYDGPDWFEIERCDDLFLHGTSC